MNQKPNPHRQAEQLWLSGHSDEVIERLTGLSPNSVTRLSNKLAGSPTKLRQAAGIVDSLSDEDVVSEVRAWISENGMPCTPRRWTDNPPDSGLSVSTLLRKYGTWPKVMRLARVPYEQKRRY